MRVIEVNSTDGLPGLRLAWRSLLGETPGAGFHQSCEWLEAACRRQSPPFRLRILVVTGGGETTGILPLVQTVRATPSGTLRTLGFPRDRWSPFYGPIGPQPTATLMAGLRHLCNRQQDWDVLELRGINRAAAVYPRTRTALEVAELRFQEADESPALVVDLAVGSNDPVACLPGDERAPLDSAASSHWENDRLTFERHRPRGAMYDDANPRWQLFDRCLELAAAETRQSEPTRQFFRDIHAASCRCGASDLNVLRRGDEILACCYNVHLGGTLLTVFASHRPSCRQLVSRMLEDSAEPRCDQRWFPGGAFPGGEFFCGRWRASPLRRVRFVVHRHRGPGRLIKRLASWLPLPS